MNSDESNAAVIDEYRAYTIVDTKITEEHQMWKSVARQYILQNLFQQVHYNSI